MQHTQKDHDFGVVYRTFKLPLTPPCGADRKTLDYLDLNSEAKSMFEDILLSHQHKVVFKAVTCVRS